MRRVWMSAALLTALAGVALPQQDPPRAEKKLVFNFKDAHYEAVLQYVCRELGWTLVQHAKPSGTTVTAYSEKEIPESDVVNFLNTALAKASTKVQVFQFGGVLKVVSEEDAKKGTYNIFQGADPNTIPINDTVRTQIIPLKNINVIDVSKELKNVLDQSAPGWSINTYANAIVVTNKSSDVYRIVRIFNILDIQAADKLDIKMTPLKFADAQETAKLLNEIFKKEQRQMGAGGGGGGMGEFFRQMMGRGGGGESGPVAKTMASEMMRITADTRTNAVITMATPENMKMVLDTIAQLDRETAEAVKLKLYPLRYAEATATAQLITQLFADEARQSAQQGRRGNPFIPQWLQGNQQGGGESTGASREVKAVADVRTNSVVVAANDVNMSIVDSLILNLDRQLTDVVQVKIYRLQHANSDRIVSVLREIFRPQVTATQNAGRPTQGGGGGGGFMQMFQQGGGRSQGGTTALAPANEVEITSDPDNNAVIMKASENYIAIADQIITDLDKAPTTGTLVIPLSNANASEVATILQNLLRGQSGGGNRAGQQQGGALPGFGNQQNRNTQQQGTRGAAGGRTGTGAGGRTGTRNLGPLDGAQDDPGFQDAPQEEETPRTVQGTVDVQPDAATNSIVIRTNPRNFESIQNIVKSLDKARPQVLIKVLIAEVTLDDSLNFGVEGFWENKFRVNGDSVTQRWSTDFNLAQQGGTSLFTGDELQVKLNALAENGKLKVLATPRILVLDNQSANINVGKEVPRITNSTINQQGNTVNTVTYESVGIQLAVQPHINFDGLVTMLVRPEISDIAPASESVPITEGVTSPTFFVNSAETTVAARNGQTVAIGGLIRESEEDSVQKIPLLGDIPILGAVFSNTVKAKIKRELMIFLTPYVAFNSVQLEELTELEKSKLKLLDRRDIDAENDKWIRLMKVKKD